MRFSRAVGWPGNQTPVADATAPPEIHVLTTMRIIAAVLAIGLTASASTGATAQNPPSQYDVVVMRRVLTSPRIVQSTPEGGPGGGTSTWAGDAWGAWSSTCSASATRSRTVSCIRTDGAGNAVPQPDSACDASSRPGTTEVGSVISGCTFAWVTTALTGWDSTCAGNASRTVSVGCQRSDGQSAAEASCSDATRPATGQTEVNTTGCTAAFADPGFETDNAWSGGNSYGTSGGVTGRYVKISQRAAAKQKASINMKANSRYKVEFWAKSGFGYGRVKVYLVGATSAVTNPASVTVTGNWTLYTVTLEPTSAANVVRPLELNFFDDQVGVWIDNVRLYAVAP